MYVTVIIPLNLEMVLTYCVPDNLRDKVVIGGRITVSLGVNRVYTAIVLDIMNDYPLNDIKYKNILSIIDTEPIIPTQQIVFWQWISKYYICSLGSVMNRFLPKGFRIKGKIEEGKDVEYDSYREVNRFNVVRLLDKNREKVITELKGKRRRVAAYEDILDFIENEKIEYIPTKRLNEIGYSNIILKALEESGHIAIESMQGINSSIKSKEEIEQAPELINATAVIDESLELLKNSCKDKKVTLLFNNTSNSTDEVIINLIKEYVQKNKNILVLTSNTVSCSKMMLKLTELFGSMVIEYNSNLSDKKTFESYNKVISKNAIIVVGTSNSLGLPFTSLGLVIVLNEHDKLYKADTTPKIMTRDCAVMLGFTYDCAVVLESRTPSVESFYNAEIGKYNLVKLDDDNGVFNDKKVTLINKFDIDKTNKSKGGFNRSENRFISKYLINAIRSNSQQGEVTMLYKNQLGYSRYMICGHCGYVPNCERCNTAMYYNKTQKKIMCSICGLTLNHIENICNRCNSDSVEYRGYGTENIDSSITEILPDIKTLRFDRESLKSHKSVLQAIDRISSGDVEVVIGTSMLLRNYGFENIATSSMVDCDTILNSSDFRAEERCFQIAIHFLSVSKELVMQSYKTDYQIMKHIVRRDYAGMYNQQIETRKAFLYPPFVRLVQINIRHSDEMSVSVTTNAIFDKLGTKIDKNKMITSKPIVDKIKNKYIMNIIIKIYPDDNVNFVKQHIKQSVNYFVVSKYFRNYYFDINVDMQ